LRLGLNVQALNPALNNVANLCWIQLLHILLPLKNFSSFLIIQSISSQRFRQFRQFPSGRTIYHQVTSAYYRSANQAFINFGLDANFFIKARLQHGFYFLRLLLGQLKGGNVD
jgi:hypothetical protein